MRRRDLLENSDLRQRAGSQGVRFRSEWEGERQRHGAAHLKRRCRRTERAGREDESQGVQLPTWKSKGEARRKFSGKPLPLWAHGGVAGGGIGIGVGHHGRRSGGRRMRCRACYIWFDRCSQQEGTSGTSPSILPGSSFMCSSLTAKSPILAFIFLGTLMTKSMPGTLTSGSPVTMAMLYFPPNVQPFWPIAR